MLRDYLYTENWRLIEAALERFIDLPERLSLVGFIDLSPDSFLWKMYDGKNVYYLYAEDYIPDLDHVRDQICDFWQKELNLEFIPAKKPISFEDATPVKAATVYTPPADQYEFERYASESGHDFVFLLKSDEKIEA